MSITKKKVLSVGKSIGSKSIIAASMVLTDGFLVEERAPKEGTDKDGKPVFVSDGYNLIAASVLSTKHRIEEFLKLMEEEDVFVQKPEASEFKTPDDAYCIKKLSRTDLFQKPLSQLETEQVTRTEVTVAIDGPEKGVENVLAVVRPDIESKVRTKEGLRARFRVAGTERDIAIVRERVKIEGCTIKEFTETTEATLFKRSLFINPKCRPDDLDGDSKEAYLIGETPEEARSQFWTILDCLTPPFQPEWEEQIWTEFKRNGWIAVLPGHRLFGYKLLLDQEKLLNMLCERVADDSLPNVIPAELEDTDPEALAA